MELSIKPVKKFFTSLYYANKKLEYAPSKKVRFGENTSESLKSKVLPYLEGYEQLANKYNFNIFVNSHSGKDTINADENIIKISQNMSASETARKVYQTVSESLRERNLL